MAAVPSGARFTAMISRLAAGASCNACHSLMDPIGLAFESFDAMGRYRTSEGGQPLDLTGEITGVSDAALQGGFNGVAELAAKLAESQQVRGCLASQWFRFAAGRSETDADACSLDAMRQTFDASGGDILELIVATTQTDAFWFRSPHSP